MDIKELDRVILKGEYYEIEDCCKLLSYLNKMFCNGKNISYYTKTVVNHRSTPWMEIKNKPFSAGRLTPPNVKDFSIYIKIGSEQDGQNKRFTLNRINCGYLIFKNGIFFYNEEAPSVIKYHAMFNAE